MFYLAFFCQGEPGAQVCSTAQQRDRHRFLRTAEPSRFTKCSMPSRKSWHNALEKLKNTPPGLEIHKGSGLLPGFPVPFCSGKCFFLDVIKPPFRKPRVFFLKLCFGPNPKVSSQGPEGNRTAGLWRRRLRESQKERETGEPSPRTASASAELGLLQPGFTPPPSPCPRPGR